MAEQDKHFEFKELIPPKGSHLDAKHHEKTVHQDDTTTRIVERHGHSSESQRLLCMEAGEGSGAAVTTIAFCLPQWMCCCFGCLLMLVILAIWLFRQLTVGDFQSSMPDLVETCVDQRETWCNAVRVIGLCAFMRSTCTYSCTSCIRFDEGEIKEIVIDVTEVPQKLAYAQTDSNVPKSLQGIWWMDQDGYLAEKGLAGKDYPYDFYPVGEYAVSFGDDAVWQPETRCLTPLYFYGGTRGHWAGGNFGNGTTCCPHNLAARLTLSLCATDDSLQELDIWFRALLPPMLGQLAETLGFEYAGHDYWWIPKGIVHLTMVKKSWGWDRVSRLAADWTRDRRDELDTLLQFFPSYLRELATTGLDIANRSLHYPMFQLVDGDGNTTEYWPHFLDFAQIKTEQNAVPGKLVLRKRVDPPAGWKKFP